MKRLLFKFFAIVLCAAAYIASPFLTAWSIREAVRNGDAAYLEHKIDWPAVRVTLAPTIGQFILDVPEAGQEPAEKPGLWQRFKAYWGQGAVNRAVESYVTPEGLTKLFNYRKLYRDYVSGQPDESKLTLQDRVKRAWARVRRAEFTSLATFEIDMVDKHDPDRMYLGKLAFENYGWRLKELRIKMTTTASNAPVKLLGISNEQPAWKSKPDRSASWSFVSPAEASPLPAPKPGLWQRIKQAAR